MVAQEQSENIDFALLEQYLEIIGQDGVTESLTTFERLMPEYLAELVVYLEQQDENEFRRQAHKVKGGCRSLGFWRLGAKMQYLERESWNWQEAKAIIDEWQDALQVDLQQVHRWLTDELR